MGMKIKTTMRYHLTAVRMAIIRKKKKEKKRKRKRKRKKMF